MDFFIPLFLDCIVQFNKLVECPGAFEFEFKTLVPFLNDGMPSPRMTGATLQLTG